MFETYNYNGNLFTVWHIDNEYILVLEGKDYIFNTFNEVSTFVVDYYKEA